MLVARGHRCSIMRPGEMSCAMQPLHAAPTSTQRDALDILQTRDGRTHQPGSAELTSYYVYGKPVLAPPQAP